MVFRRKKWKHYYKVSSLHQHEEGRCGVKTLPLRLPDALRDPELAMLNTSLLSLWLRSSEKHNRALRSGGPVSWFLETLLGTRRPLHAAFFTAIHTTALGLCQVKFFTFFENRILSLSLLKLVIYSSYLKLLIFQVVKDITISKYVLKFNSFKDLNNATGSISLFSLLKNLGGGYHYWSFAELWGLFDKLWHKMITLRKYLIILIYSAFSDLNLLCAHKSLKRKAIKIRT